MTTEGSPSVHRAIAILLALGTREAVERGGLGVVEIARRVGKEKSQISRALRVLAETGMVERDSESLEYRLGWRMFTLVANAGQQRLLAEGPTVLRKLVVATRERAHLSVREADGALTVLSESPLRTVQTVGWVGRITPLYSTSAGRALMFDHDDEEIRGLLQHADFGSAGPNAATDPEQWIERHWQARKRGYALVDEEFEAGLVGAGAPVRDAYGRIVAALNVSAPKFRIDNGLDKLGRMVRTAAEQLSASIGGGSTAPSGAAGGPRSAATNSQIGRS